MSISVVVKQIKPSRLKVDAMRLELLNAMRRMGTQMRRDFEATTATWEHKPKFEQVISLKGSPSVLVGTDDEIYRYVSEGTKPHIIKPVRAKRLAFRGTYSAKTTPGIIGSRAGGASGDRLYRQVVRHPGTEARHFGEAIEKKWRKPFKREMEAAMKAAAKKSGHRI